LKVNVYLAHPIKVVEVRSKDWKKGLRAAFSRIWEPLKDLVILGDLSSTEAIVEFLSSSEALDLPDKIEEVNAKRLELLILEKIFIAVLFCKTKNATTWVSALR
jgi:hypothetical protein